MASIFARRASARLNIVLVAGQSNADGVYGSHDVDALKPEKGSSYWWNGSGLTDLSEKVTNQEEALSGKSVGWYPALAAEWYARTGEKTVIIHRCASGSPISKWASYDGTSVTDVTTGTANAVKTCIAAIQENSNYTIEHAGYYWLQGETDAQQGTTADAYAAAFKAMHGVYISALQTANVSNVYGAILSVRPCTWKPWKDNVSYEPTRVAQLYLANNTESLYMASVITDSWHGEGSVQYTSKGGYTVAENTYEQLAGGNAGHYTQSGYNVIGLDAADHMYDALENPKSVSEFDVIGYDGYTVYTPFTPIKLADNVQKDDSTKAQLVVMPNPISATCSEVTMTLKDADGNAVEGAMDPYGLIDLKKVTGTLTLEVTAGGTTKAYKVTADGTSVPDDDAVFQNYYWDFTDESKLKADNTMFAAVTGNGWSENDLTYVKAVDDSAISLDGKISDAGYTDASRKQYFKTSNDIVLKKDSQWQIEWKGSLNLMSQAILANNYDSVNSSANWNEKKEYLYFEASGNILMLRPGGLHNENQFKNIPGEIATRADTVWTLKNNGSGSLTLAYQNGSEHGETVVTGQLKDTYVFNGVLGRFEKNDSTMAACYSGTIEYLKVYDPGTIAKELKVQLKDGVAYQLGDRPAKDDLTVMLVYMDGSEVQISDYTIAPDRFTTAGKQNLTVNAQGVQGSVEVDVAATFEPRNYYWNFMDSSKLGADGSSFASVTGSVWSENGLTYVSAQDDSTKINAAGNFSSNGYSAEKAKAHYFKLADNIILKKDMSWRIEWKGSFTDASVAILANNDDEVTANKDTFGDKQEYLYYDHMRGTLSLRSGATSDGQNVLEVPKDVAQNSETVWVLQNDGQGKLTISYQNEDAQDSKAISGKLNDAYIFDGVFGRFAKVSENMAACYAGTMSYLKVWENAQNLTISYVDGISEGAGSANVVAGNEVAVKAAPSAKTGYEFIGWNTEADGTGTSYKPSEVIAPEQDIELHAQWRKSTSVAITGTTLGGQGSLLPRRHRHRDGEVRRY